MTTREITFTRKTDGRKVATVYVRVFDDAGRIDFDHFNEVAHYRDKIEAVHGECIVHGRDV